MPAPTPVSILNAAWAAVLSGRDLMNYSSTTMSTTERHASIYSNGRIVTTYEYYFSSDTGNVFTHSTNYGQWWIQNSWLDASGYHANVAVYWYDSTDAATKGTTSVFAMSTSNGGDFTIGGSLYGSSLITDATGDGNDTIDGSATATIGPTMVGKGGNDRLVGNDAHNDHLYGGTGHDSLLGGGGDDFFCGDAGDDVLNGGAGTDLSLYFAAADKFAVRQTGFDTYEITDTQAQSPEGTDSLIGVEYVQFGSATPVAIESLLSAGNDVLTGANATSDFLSGGAGNDSLSGLLGNDTLLGGADNDTLIGGGGADVMLGGAGNDTFEVDSLSDKVYETASTAGGADTGGVDLVRAGVTWTLGSFQEDLILTGTNSTQGTGNTLNNRLTGNTGNNVLNGLGGVDTLQGGLGNDTYLVDTTNDVVIEVSGEGTDTVKSTASFTLSADVENLILTGTGAINATGNNLKNTITAGPGNNVLDGGTGVDTVSYARSPTKVTVSLANGATAQTTGGSGSDLIKNFENLTGSGFNDRLTGSAEANTLIGGEGNDSLIGGAGSDILSGGTGNDNLSGGLGQDSFLFNTAPNATTNLDKITGFVVAEDTLRLENAVYSKLGAPGVLKSANFRIGTAALDADDYVLFDKATGTLSYDADGSAAGAAVQIALLKPGLALTNLNLVVV